MSNDFYLTLPSNSNKVEFTQNKANHFKIRLPNPIRLEGSGWKVGSSSISLPDAKVKVPVLVAPNETLFHMSWLAEESDGFLFNRKANYEPSDLRQVFSNIDGVGFMKAMITFFEQRRIYNDGGPHYGSTYRALNGKRMYIAFRWNGEDLLTDNVDTFMHDTKPPVLKINQSLALKMGWIKQRGSGNYDLGPNLCQVFFTDTVPDLKNITHDVEREDGTPAFWSLKGGLLHLSILCNWRFMNLDKSFQNVVGTKSRSLFVYSDVGGSSVVGNQVTDLLREVNYRRKGEGVQYFEPLHIKYIPLRKDVLDIIETQVSETTGELTDFGEGDTIVTLHFKRK